MTQAQGLAIAPDGSVLGLGYSMGTIHNDALVSAGGTTTNVGTLTPTASATDGRIVGICPITNANGFIIDTACQVDTGGQLTLLPTLPGGHDSYAYDTSDEGWIVGGAFANNALVPTPVVWINASPIDMGTLGGNAGQAHAINGNRQVVGWATNAAGEPHGFVYQLGAGGSVLSRTEIGTFDGKASHARDLNDAGDVVGTSGSHAFLYAGGQMADLNSLIDPSSGWELVDATAINASGQIVGVGRLDGHDLRAFLLTPTQPCPADVNGDGVLTAADFTAWIAAFNAGAPGCDQNADGNCDPTDFTAWIANFNAGCQ